MTKEEAIWYLTPIAESASLEKYKEALTMAISALQNQPVWIPVTERLPEPNETVLVYRKFWNFGMDRYDGESFIHKDVTHWIPMPKLPEKV